ncbi:MAG: HPr family phosphocarrier protein [Caldicoprobacterales bacterium]|nr:HPr family phosphocarrier protein [Clostridiales bacterium]
MISKETMVKLESGLHARPAAKFVQLSKRFTSKLLVSYNGKSADPKSILGLMALGAGKGSVIVITAEGEDEAQAVDALVDFVQQSE